MRLHSGLSVSQVWVRLGQVLFATVVVLKPTLTYADSLAVLEVFDRSRTLINDVAAPLHATFVEETQRLAADLELLCERPSAKQHTVVTESFKTVLDRWQRVSVFTFGPLMTKYGPSRFQFWPDRRGTGARQRRKVYASEPVELLDSSVLQGKSVALSDIQALESLLFTEVDGLLAAGAYRCQLARSIAQHQSHLALELAQGWFGREGVVGRVNSLPATQSVAKQRKEIIRDVYGSATTTLQNIIGAKLARPLGIGGERARPKRAESRRSARSLENIRAQLEVVDSLIAQPGGFADLLHAHGQSTAAEQLKAHFESVFAQLNAVPSPLYRAVEDPTHYETLLLAREELIELWTTLMGAN